MASETVVANHQMFWLWRKWPVNPWGYAAGYMLLLWHMSMWWVQIGGTQESFWPQPISPPVMVSGPGRPGSHSQRQSAGRTRRSRRSSPGHPKKPHFHGKWWSKWGSNGGMRHVTIWRCDICYHQTAMLTRNVMISGLALEFETPKT